MGWCSATTIFDQIVEAVLSEKPLDKKAVIKAVMFHTLSRYQI